MLDEEEVLENNLLWSTIFMHLINGTRTWSGNAFINGNF